MIVQELNTLYIAARNDTVIFFLIQPHLVPVPFTHLSSTGFYETV